MGLKTLFAAMLLTALPCAAEEEVLITMDFVLKAGASQTRTFKVHKPERTGQLVMVGFNPTKALSMDCTLWLFNSSGKALGTYSCNQLEIHQLTQALPKDSVYSAKIEVSNSNFSAATSSFSVINRFKFI